jgi:hypothetical protein
MLGWLSLERVNASWRKFFRARSSANPCRKKFQGNISIQPLITYTINRSHPTRASLLENVIVAEGLADMGRRYRHHLGVTPIASYNAAFWYTTPSFTVVTTRRMSLMRALGSPSTRIRSASLPGEIDPNS